MKNELNIVETGQKSSQIIYIFVHGFGGESGSWDLVLKELNKKSSVSFDAVTYDLRGAGKSTHQIDSHIPFLENHVIDLDTIIQKYGRAHKKIVLVGHCLGSLIVQEWLSKHDNSIVHQVVLLSAPNYLRGIQLPEKLLSFSSHYFQENDVEKNIQDQKEFIGTHDFNLYRIRNDAKSMGYENYVLYFLNLLGAKTSEWKNPALIPTLVLIGENDSLFSVEEMTVFAKSIHAKQVHTIAHANHVLPLNAATEVASEIASFQKVILT